MFVCHGFCLTNSAPLHVGEVHFLRSAASCAWGLPSWAWPALLLGLYLLLLFFFFTVLQPDWPPCCSSNKLGISCSRALTPPVPSAWTAFPQTAPELPLTSFVLTYFCTEGVPSQCHPHAHLHWQPFLHPFPAGCSLHGTCHRLTHYPFLLLCVVPSPPNMSSLKAEISVPCIPCCISRAWNSARHI